MNYELAFSIVGLLAMSGWLVLLVSPLLPQWMPVVAGQGLPVVMSVGYVTLILFFPTPSGGFSTFADVTELFSHPQALMAGWVHFLAFDLFVGGWICRTAHNEDIRFLWALPCLPLTFLFGPAGYLCFQIIRLFLSQRQAA